MVMLAGLNKGGGVVGNGGKKRWQNPGIRGKTYFP